MNYSFDCGTGIPFLISSSNACLSDIETLYYYSSVVENYELSPKNAILKIKPFNMDEYYPFVEPKKKVCLFSGFSHSYFNASPPAFKQFHLEIYERMKKYNIEKPHIFTHRGFLKAVSQIVHDIIDFKQSKTKKNMGEDFSFDVFLHDGVCFFDMLSRREITDRFNFGGRRFEQLCTNCDPFLPSWGNPIGSFHVVNTATMHPSMLRIHYSQELDCFRWKEFGKEKGGENVEENETEKENKKGDEQDTSSSSTATSSSSSSSASSSLSSSFSSTSAHVAYYKKMMTKLPPLSKSIELKTVTDYTTDFLFTKYKLFKYWLQCYIGGIRKLFVGIRNQDGVLCSAKKINVPDIDTRRFLVKENEVISSLNNLIFELRNFALSQKQEDVRYRMSYSKEDHIIRFVGVNLEVPNLLDVVLAEEEE